MLCFLVVGMEAATLHTVGAYPCNGDQSEITVSNFTVIFDKDTNIVTYTVEGYSSRMVKVIRKYSIKQLTTFLPLCLILTVI